MAIPSLIAFGAIAQWPASERLDQIRTTLQSQPSLAPVRKAIQDLPSVWQALAQQDSNLDSAGEAAAEQLSQWVVGASPSQNLQDRGNVTRMPLTAIAQLVHYISYLRQGEEPHEAILKSVASGGGIQGFCIGLLSALAVASAKTEDEVGKYAAGSVQLAFCVGTYVDLDQHRNGEESKATTLAVRWKAPTTLDDVQRLLEKHEDTYIAVVRDIRDATITTPAKGVDRLLAELKELGASSIDTGVSGRYHSLIHEGKAQTILNVCQARFAPNANGQALVRSNTDSSFFSDENAALKALECILRERADWFTTISEAASALKNAGSNPFILSIGADAIPQSVARTVPVVKARMINESDAVQDEAPSPDRSDAIDGYPKDAIAIIGMAGRFPGCNDLDEYWSILKDCKSMLSEAPEGRFGKTARTKDGQRFWGNFLKDVEGFDHSFFKRSPREAASMDPQQRLLLELAYESLEMSGYFGNPSKPQDVGVYIGACATDYDFNVACHPANAYSATGTLRSFLSGKLSHYFGWYGPSLVLDTACSSSAVAIHTACTALKTGQCSQALAGGVTLMTSPYLYENFNAAHFLTPTGASKAFSADADGYCRGEGGGLVVLKRLSDAIKDADNIIGVIGGSAVNQNDNCVPITVPHTSSQGNLYEQVSKQAGVTARDISFVEAHGTGTPVGDPIEMESIRRIFGGPKRDSPLIVSSTKGNIGHLEGASGVAALIKTILQMQYRQAPPQASFKSLNPKISALEPDNLLIPRSTMTLPNGRLAACVNNYGAAGSNAAMIILAPPPKPSSQEALLAKPSQPVKLPIQITAASEKSLLSYCATLDKLCGRFQNTLSPPERSHILPNMAYSLSKRLNQDLAYSLTFTSTDVDQFQAQIREQTAQKNAIKERSSATPVVLCFGGQVSDKVGLDKSLWEQSALLRFHLDACDSTAQALGFPSIYPGIFETQPVTDVVELHTMLFAIQYATAQCWIDSGLKVASVIGHSFGQLTALCASGMLSLQDGLKLASGRAVLMKKYWGPETGTMVAVPSGRETVDSIRDSLPAPHDFEIACFNGPSFHVLVADKASAEAIVAKLSERSIKHKKLDVPYGFHSRFTQPLLPHLEELAHSLVFREPKIPIETCTDVATWSEPSAERIVAHTREPVFFGQAIERLQRKFGACTWVECGSSSGITNMARGALGAAYTTGSTFVPMQLDKPNSADLLADVTVSLWNAGQKTQFWGYHRLQAQQYDRLRLPTYSWEKTKHWLELNMSEALGGSKAIAPQPAKDTPVELPPILLRQETAGKFVVSPKCEEFRAIVKDLESLGKCSAPSALYIELATRAFNIASGNSDSALSSIEEFYVHSLLDDKEQQDPITLTLQQNGQHSLFKINSGKICIAQGTIVPQSASGNLTAEFSRYERLTGHSKASSVANDPQSESIRGNVLYKMMSSTTNYPSWYRGVKSVATLGAQVAASVVRPAGTPDVIAKGSVTQLSVLESFIQVASLHANCLSENAGNEAFRFTKAHRLQWAPGYDAKTGSSWDVLAFTANGEDDGVVSDMYIYDSETRQLVLLMLGVQFANAGKPTVAPAQAAPAPQPVSNAPPPAVASQSKQEPQSPPSATEKPKASKPAGKSAKTAIFEDVAGLLEELADIPAAKCPADASFDDLGVDSLMVIEVISELQTHFKVDMPIDELEQLTDLKSLTDYLHSKGAVGSTYDSDSDDSAEDSGPSTEASTPATTASTATSPPESPAVAAKPDTKDVPPMTTETGNQPLDLGPTGMQEAFSKIRFDWEKHAAKVGASSFWTTVYPHQADVVCAYVVEAYRKLGVDLSQLQAGDQVPHLTEALPKHKHLLAQMRNILVDSGVLELSGMGANQQLVRTSNPIDTTPIETRYQRLLEEYPAYVPDTKCLKVTAPLLAECLSGTKEPLNLLFGDRKNREILGDFYAKSPLLDATCRLLAEFISTLPAAAKSNGALRILEVGGGTGGTTKYLVDYLDKCGIKFEYTFTDISQALVNQTKKFFAGRSDMEFRTFNADKPAPEELLNKYHLVLSTNCIHATSSIERSVGNIRPVLRDDGAICVLEFTKNLYWFDLVFGLLEGWWLMDDSRTHALAPESFWDSSLRAAGYKHVSWTTGESEEANTLRLICGFKSAAATQEIASTSKPSGRVVKRAGIPMEEVVFKTEGSLDLSADVYFPKTADPAGKKRGIGM